MFIKSKSSVSISLFAVLIILFSCKNQSLIEAPQHGFISNNPASKWEESLITGNGTIGALVIGDALNERIILSHEKLLTGIYHDYKNLTLSEG